MECYSVAFYRNWLKGICGVFLFNTNCCTIKITDEGCVIDNAVDSKSLSTDSYLYVTTHINIVPKWHKSLQQGHSQTTHNKTLVLRNRTATATRLPRKNEGENKFSP